MRVREEENRELSRDQRACLGRLPVRGAVAAHGMTASQARTGSSDVHGYVVVAHMADPFLDARLGACARGRVLRRGRHRSCLGRFDVESQVERCKMSRRKAEGIGAVVLSNPRSGQW